MSARPGMFRSWLAAFLALSLLGGVSACLFGAVIYAVTAVVTGP